MEGMEALFAARPATFESEEAATAWSVEHGLIHEGGSVGSQLVREHGKWTWRTDVMATRPHWEGWFDSMSTAFLSAPARKLLVLTGHDLITRDKDLMIGQMQGTFQFEVLPASHVMQEDEPERTAQILVTFALHCSQLAQPVLPKGSLFL